MESAEEAGKLKSLNEATGDQLFVNFYQNGVCLLQQPVPPDLDIPEFIAAMSKMDSRFDDATLVDDEGNEIDWTDL